jgi:acetate---CoA ligase (ADP-forming)
MHRDLSAFLRPQAIAVVGASPRPGSVGGTILRNLLSCGFTGRIHPVNPNHDRILNLPCYHALDEVPTSTDMAVLAINRDLVLSAVEACGEHGIRNLIIITAGFKEAGPDGVELERRLRELISRFDLRVVGPNCMGVIHHSETVRLNASFSRWFVPGGGIGFISQSGSLGESLLESFDEAGLGVSTFINLGNRAGLTENDFLRHLASDPSCRTIFLYLESFADPAEFRRILSTACRDKAVVVLKAGRTQAGAAAVASHTGSLASSDAVVDAFLRQSGALRVTTIDDALSALRVLQRDVLPEGNRVVILTNAGGAGIIAADACERMSIEVPRLPETVISKLKTFLPPEAGYGNPIDMIATADSSDYERSLKETLPAVDAAILIFLPPVVYDEPVEAVADGILRVMHDTPGKPVLVCTLSRSQTVAPLVKRLQSEQVPSYVMPESAVGAMDVLCRVRRLRRQAETQESVTDPRSHHAQQILEGATREGRTGLYFNEGAEILRAYGIEVCPHAYIDSLEEGVEFLRSSSGSMVLKIDSPHVLHRVELGAVFTAISTEHALAEAYAALRAAMEGLEATAPNARLLAQTMLAGRELILGMERDAVFGPAVVFGLGGTLVEVLRDVSFGVAPISRADASEMIRSIRAFPLLEAFRGQPAVDLDALGQTIVRLAQMAEALPELAELDLNPVIATPDGIYAVDILVRIHVDGASDSAESTTPA